MGGHTKEPWGLGATEVSSKDDLLRIFKESLDAHDGEVGDYFYEVFSADGKRIAFICGPTSGANSERIFACVNSCEGIPLGIMESWLNPPEGQLGKPHGTWAQQLAAAGKRIVELEEMIETLCNGIAWNIEHHPDVMNESDAEALRAAHTLLDKSGVEA